MANMSNYQDFLATFAMLNQDSNKYQTESLPIESLRDKIKFYEQQMGAKTEDERQHYYEFRTRMMNNYISQGMRDAKVFEIDKIEKRLLLLTDSPKSQKLLQMIKLPFRSIFIDMDISADELPEKIRHPEGSDSELVSINGILIMEMITTAGRNDYFLKKGIADNEKTVGRVFYVAYALKHLKQGLPYRSIYDLFIPIEDYDEEGHGIKYDPHGKLNLKFFRNFIINFCLFLSHPDVEQIEIRRSHKNAERRASQGKIALPSSNKIKITGSLKRYIGRYGTSLSGNKLDHAVWVRGTWRHHYSDWYKNMKGKIIWIAPFIRGIGKGEPVNKTYSVEASKEDKERYDNEFLFFDDIPELDKPLREMDYNERKRNRR